MTEPTLLAGPRAALSFLTVLPVGGEAAARSVHLGRAWFPAVGLLLGSLRHEHARLLPGPLEAGEALFS